MRLLWVQDLSPFKRVGGAQLTDYTHIIAGIRRGHDIVPMISEDGPVDSELPCDGAIVSNCASFPPAFFKRLHERGVPTVFLYHDFTCRWRLFYPMQDKCRQCYLRERWIEHYQNARLLVWLSPLHRDSFLFEFPELLDHQFALVPSPVRTADFFPTNQPRQGVLVTSGFLAFKGRRNILSWAEANPSIPITAIAYAEEDQAQVPPNISLITPQPHSAMNALYNKHEVLLHLPSTTQPFERTCAEAILAGCRVVGNELVGALSYPWFTSAAEVAKHCDAAPEDFWVAVERVLA